MDVKSKNCGFITIYCDFEPSLKIAIPIIPMGKNCGSPQKLRKIAEKLRKLRENCEKLRKIAGKLRTAIPPCEHYFFLKKKVS